MFPALLYLPATAFVSALAEIGNKIRKPRIDLSGMEIYRRLQNAIGAPELHRVVEYLETDLEKASSLVQCLSDTDGNIRARAVSVLERLSRRHPELVKCAGTKLLSLCVSEEPWFVRMDTARLLPLVDWSGEDREKVLRFLVEQADGNNRFVAAWALDSLGKMAESDPEIFEIAMPRLLQALQQGRGAVSTRARHRLAELRKAGLS
jgi:hypothetical protein